MKAHFIRLKPPACCNCRVTGAALLGLLFALADFLIAGSPPQYAEENGLGRTATTTRTAPTAFQPAPASPALTLVPPFVGTHSETWESFPRHLADGTSILGGLATISGDNMLVENRFTMCTVIGRPSDGAKLMDSDRPYDLVIIYFSVPVSAFGAYWGSGYHCPQCCGFSDAPTILTFQDVNGNVIGSDSFFYQGNGALMWRGYTFATPVATITRTAGDGQEGVAIDGLQATVYLKINSIASPASNTIHLNCVGAPGVINRIEWSPDLSPGSFHTLASRMADATGAFQYDDTSAGTKKFYRAAYP